MLYTGSSLGGMPPIVSLAGLPVIPPGRAGPSSALSSWAGRPGQMGIPASIPSLAGAAATSAMSNLLPFALRLPSAPAVGVYVGEGLPPVPAKLAERIGRWEFIEMSEMLPEFWTQSRSDEAESKPTVTRRRRQVTEIFTWIQCFCTYVGVLGGKHPESVPELMTYLIMIIRVSQDFAGVAWVRYDAAFRRQAAITGNRRWSQINPSLYSICFTGWAQQSSRCELCFNSTHQTKEYALMAEADPELPARLKAVEAAVVSLATHRLPETKPTMRGTCHLFNANRCRFTRCRFRHACSRIGEPHPVISCPRREVKREDQPKPAGRRDLSRPYN